MGDFPVCYFYPPSQTSYRKKIEQTAIKKLQELETKTAVCCDFCFKSWSGTQRQGSPIVCALC